MRPISSRVLRYILSRIIPPFPKQNEKNETKPSREKSSDSKTCFCAMFTSSHLLTHNRLRMRRLPLEITFTSTQKRIKLYNYVQWCLFPPASHSLKTCNCVCNITQLVLIFRVAISTSSKRKTQMSIIFTDVDLYVLVRILKIMTTI